MIARILVLVFLFGLGSLEAFALKLRNTAVVTWMIALLALTSWVGYSLSAIRLCLAIITFTCGLTLIVVYYKRAGTARSARS